MNSAVLFLDHSAEVFGSHTAVESEECSVTFAELRGQSMSLATYLLKKLPPTGRAVRPVMVYLPKSVASIVSFMGALYGGCTYVPLDYAVPLKRLQLIIDNTSPLFIITDADGAARLDELSLGGAEVVIFGRAVKTEADAEAVRAAVDAVLDCDPIYIMYTSGSTGTPKGVVIPHRGVIDYARWVTGTFGLDSETVIGNQSAFYFDNSVLDIYSCLLAGAKLVIIPEVLFMFPVKIPEFLDEKKINFAFFVPTVVMNIATSGALDARPLTHLNKLLFCGEVMPNQHLNIWRRTNPHIRYANLYGPTEITDVCIYYEIDREFEDSDPLPIGRPCANMDAIILAENDTLCPAGQIGELCILGSALALGYWNAPEITARAFCRNPANPHFPEMIYRTGDLAYIRDDGIIMYVGRRDSQIKFKGNRIELGDIESAIKSLDSVGNACVLFDSEHQEIVAFLTGAPDITLRQMNVRLKELIPKYMFPGRLIKMDKFPLTPNRKVDRLALKELF